MRTCFTIGVVAVLCAIGLFALSQWHQVEAKAYTAQMQLAYDASTPSAKAQYLRKFIATAEKDTTLPEYGAWIIRRDDLKVSNQLDVLRTLAQRCEQLASIDPASMGFSQGMTQVTNDEFEYTISQTREFFIKARFMSGGWFKVNGWWQFFAVGAVFLFFGWAIKEA